MDNKSQISSITFKQTIYVDRTKKTNVIIIITTFPEILKHRNHPK